MVKRPSNEVLRLPTEQLVEIVDGIRDALWFDFEKNEYDSQKEWNMDTLEYISGLLSDLGLTPEDDANPYCF